VCVCVCVCIKDISHIERKDLFWGNRREKDKRTNESEGRLRWNGRKISSCWQSFPIKKANWKLPTRNLSFFMLRVCVLWILDPFLVLLPFCFLLLVIGLALGTETRLTIDAKVSLN